MNVKNTMLVVALLFCFSACKMSKVQFLEGTWQVENKEQYEVWEKGKPRALTGYSYKMNGEKQVITETLCIRAVDNALVYEATVPNQNQGQTIPFALNTKENDFLSFENMAHDFPQKIQYQQINEDEILVRVLGENNQGFSYKIFKRK